MRPGFPCRLAAAFASAFLAANAHAATVSVAGDCDATGQTQIDIDACAVQALQKEDRELNVLYARLVKREDAASVKQLQAAQRAWLQFRDLECVYETPDAGGSIAPMALADCRTELTKERITGLKRVLRQQIH